MLSDVADACVARRESSLLTVVNALRAALYASRFCMTRVLTGVHAKHEAHKYAARVIAAHELPLLFLYYYYTAGTSTIVRRWRHRVRGPA
jgi:hypothetical protein